MFIYIHFLFIEEEQEQREDEEKQNEAKRREEKTAQVSNEDSTEATDAIFETDIEVDEKPRIDTIDISPEVLKPIDIVYAAEKIISFYEENKMLTKRELAIIKKAKDLAQNLNDNNSE